MIFHSFFQCKLQNVRVTQINLWNSGWRWRRRIVQDAFQQPNTALQWVRILAVGIHRQEARLSQQATPLKRWRQVNPTKLMAKHFR